MSSTQKGIKALAIVLCIIIIATIVTGIIKGFIFLGYTFNLIELDDTYNEIQLISKEDEGITSLDLELGAIELSIEEGDTFSIRTNKKNINYTNNEGKVTVKDTKKHIFGIHSNKTGKLIVTVPDETNLEYINLETGAGSINLKDIITNKVKFEFGAGVVTINNLTVNKSASIETGAGEVSIKESYLSNLDLECGIGEVELSSTLTGANEINGGIGNFQLNLLDSIDNYTIKSNKGIGQITLNGQSLTNDQEVGEGPNSIKIEAGIGSVNIKTTEE